MEHGEDPIGAAVGVLGDRWMLLILRDVIVEDRRYFRALLLGSAEGIASNILADRLVRLVEAGLLVRGTAARGQRARYSLTEAGIQTVPIFHALGVWGRHWRTDGTGRSHRPASTTSASLEELMDELRAEHLGASPDPDLVPDARRRARAIVRTAGDAE